jgi:hypothetical protein
LPRLFSTGQTDAMANARWRYINLEVALALRVLLVCEIVHMNRAAYSLGTFDQASYA